MTDTYGVTPSTAVVKHERIPARHRVMIIEDDPILGPMLVEMVSMHYDVLLVDCADDVLDSIERNDIELVLLDLMLPDVDGFELLTAIRQAYPTEKLAIIILSALDDAKAIVEGFELGANDYIVKPVEAQVMIARIATQLKLIQLQDERNRYIANLEKSETIRQQLNQIASHDLKNPINNLRIAESLLREEVPNTPRVQQLINTIGASLDMMEQVVDAFLDMVAIQTRSITLKVESISMRDIINNAVAQYELAADSKQVTVETGSTDGVIIADPGRMAQIAGNLVSNAIKYTPRGSTIRIWSEKRGENQRLSVSDEGAGVPEEERHLLFKEFGKLSTRPTAGEGSTGLGLWIVKHLVELQRGRVGADFPEEGGSIFWIELKRAPDQS